VSVSSSPIPASDAAALAGLSHRPTARARRRPGRILRGLGILCLVAALAIGAHIAWLLWGTGIETAHAQKQLRAQILEQFKEQAQHPLPVNPKTHHPVVSIKEGQPVGILVIQKIHLDMVLVNGTSTADLKKGPGHYIGTAYPWEEKGTTAIAGHRTTYLHPFWSLDKLAKGDLIRIRTRFGTFDYHVTRIMTIQPSEAWVLDQTKKATLVLTTCTPKFSASHRLVVFASR
jgi:sortase A